MSTIQHDLSEYCNGCPFYDEADWCNSAGRYLNPDDSAAPDWCPLRKSPIIVVGIVNGMAGGLREVLEDQ